LIMRYGLTCDDDDAGLASLATTTLLAGNTVSMGRYGT
jgi:hypothetical protein